MENEPRRSYDVSAETKKVDASKWTTMSANELMDQKMIIMERAQVLGEMGKLDALRQINQQLARIDILIRQKSGGGTNTII